MLLVFSSREQIYQRFLERFFGFREYADRTIDGGLIGKRKLMADTRVPGLIKQDTRVMILTSNPKYSWNLYWILLNTRDTREADVRRSSTTGVRVSAFRVVIETGRVVNAGERDDATPADADVPGG